MHNSVLLDETIDNLNIRPNGIYVDATLGYGGHSEEILKRLTTGHLYAFEQDKMAIMASEDRLSKYQDKLTIIHSNFVNLKECLGKENISLVDGIIFDLGFSSPQIDDPKRGFSFMQDAKLDMRMNQEQKLSAYEVVNNYSLEDLTNIFYKYAEEKYSKSIAKNIVFSRPINNTLELVDIIKRSVPLKYALSRHPERVIFQAIRIEVNKELEVLEGVLPDAIDILGEGGRICVITFHSLEDRIVKQTFKCESEINSLVRGLRSEEIPEEFKPRIKLINKKPILPSDEEMKKNGRSKSAKLRVIERV